jgi:cytoskeletal protein CcmA (bactofilin family)
MNRKIKLFIILLTLAVITIAAEFKSGDKAILNNPVHDDLYVAGGLVTIQAPVYGDVIAAGGTINLNDSVLEDVLVAGGNIFINGYVGDDIRVAGGMVVINGVVEGDVIAAGGKITVSSTAHIKGDLVVAGGEIVFEGTLDGSIKAKGGHITINGKVLSGAVISANTLIINGYISGSSTISATELELGNNASFDGNIEYWTAQGQVDFSSHQKSGTASYNEDLKMEDKDVSMWWFLILYFLSAILLITVIYFLFKNATERAGLTMQTETGRSIGYGMLYLIGIPLVAILIMITIIAIPLSLIVLNIYLLTILLSHIISSIVIAQWIKQKNNKKWNNFLLLLISIGIYLVLKIIFFIPVVGFLANLLIVALVFGALILQYKKRKETIVDKGYILEP